MEKDNIKNDLDDFWIELINKSKWAKDAAYKNPNDFKNLNILAVKKNNINYELKEEKIGLPKIEEVKKNTVKKDKITIFLYSAFIFFSILLLLSIFYKFVYYPSIFDGKIRFNKVNVF